MNTVSVLLRRSLIFSCKTAAINWGRGGVLLTVCGVQKRLEPALNPRGGPVQLLLWGFSSFIKYRTEGNVAAAHFFFYKLLISVSVFVQYFPFICVPLFSYFIFSFGTVKFHK